MANFSFDITSEYDKAEMNNVFMATERELTGRYDFKGTPAAIEWRNDKTGFKLIGNSDWQIESIIDIIRKKLASREQSSKVLDLSESIITSNLKATKEIPFVSKLDQPKAKQLSSLLREHNPKLKAQIQGEVVRVTSSSKDDLQQAMTFLKSQDIDFPLFFTNFR